MTISALSSLDEVSFDLKSEEDLGTFEILARKVQSIWARIYDAVTDTFATIVYVVRRSIGTFIRNAFFFPLKWPLFAQRQLVQRQMEIEKSYSRDFWDPSKPLDLNFKDQAKIREKFAPPEDRIFSIQLQNGETVEITCRILETKEKGASQYNFVHVPGIYATIYNNVVGIYPYLAAFVNRDEPLPGGRFITISENNLHYKPATLEEAGYILRETLKVLKEEFGEIDQVVAHSLGTVLLTSALKQTEDPKLLPKHICMDRGPTSTWEASKKYFWGLGCLFFFLLKFAEWASDTEEDLVQFCQKWEERPSLLIMGVKQDHHFSSSANLCLGEKIKKIERIDRLLFDPPRQVFHTTAQHNLRPDFLHSLYLTTPSDFMNSSENLAEAIIRHSLPSLEKKEQSA